MEFVDNRAFIPICELLDYIIDEHFEDAVKRQELHAQARDIRQHWEEVGYQYEAMAGRVGQAVANMQESGVRCFDGNSCKKRSKAREFTARRVRLPARRAGTWIGTMEMTFI